MHDYFQARSCAPLKLRMPRTWTASHKITSRLHHVVPDLSGDPYPTKSVNPPSSDIKHYNIPTWSAYNSFMASTKPFIEVIALSLIPAPGYEWQTLITVLKQTQQINCMVMGHNRKTVTTLGTVLYERAKQLDMSRDDCKGKWMLRLGGMHTVVAALRAADNAIEDSELEEARFEADIYEVESQHRMRH